MEWGQGWYAVGAGVVESEGRDVWSGGRGGMEWEQGW